MKTGMKKLGWSGVALSLLGLLACQGTPHRPEAFEPPSEKVQFIDPSLSQMVSASYTQWKERDVLNIQVKLTNRTDQKLYLEYQFYFYTADGRQVQSPFAYWRPIILEAKETQAAQANVLTRDVNTFTLALRKAQPLQAQ